MLKEVINWLKSVLSFVITFSLNTSVSAEPVKPKRSVDTRKFTKADFDIIMREYESMKQSNKHLPKKVRLTTYDLTELLNESLGFDKSRSSYSRVWTGKVDRNKLKD